MYNNGMSLFAEFLKDFQAVLKNDPAARGVPDVLFNYAGFHAIVAYRVIHRMWTMGMRTLPRLMSQVVRWLTGVEIHPAAIIAPGVFIDHGMGVVIGETAEVGTGCVLYQGVTLGGTGKELGKRHPTVGCHVVIGAGAKVLGPITIGDYVKIGANSVVLQSAPESSIVVGVPGRVIKRKMLRVHDEGTVEMVGRASLPDPVERKFKELEMQISHLEKKIESLQGRSAMKVYNTMTGTKEEFLPIEGKQVGMYACGVTVYDLCHVGHARSAIVFDVIRKYLGYKGFRVKFVRNFTDIDDKIINRARRDGIPWDEVAARYTAEYFKDMERLGVSRADVEPKATEHINEILTLITGLIDKGYAYEVDGDVYYEVRRFIVYGKLSKKDIGGLESGARVEVDERKRSPLDFALWKKSKEGEPAWESPWGAGRPGWHIECSAMSMKYLGESFDIHGGGADLIFPHHENEIAQSEAFSGRPFARYWLHNGFITIDKEKMSKSLGNFFTIRDILEKFDPEVLRLFLISTHYRSPIEFSDEQLRYSESAIDRYYLTVLRVEDYIRHGKAGKKKDVEPGDLNHMVEEFRNGFVNAMDDDFNSALAIGHVFELIKEINRHLDAGAPGADSKEVLRRALKALDETGEVLNIFRKTPADWYRSLMATRNIPLSPDEIENMIARRMSARAAKDWANADVIRKELEDKGIILEDKTDGTTWRVKI
jgi:cysteinyl-tRNA synthetase